MGHWHVYAGSQLNPLPHARVNSPFPQFPVPAAAGGPQVHAMMGGRPWMAPVVSILPALALLQVQTGDPIDGGGGTGGGGSSVF
jgi:hypothetical protein